MIECWGDNVPSGKVTSFPLAVKAQPDETVVLGFVEWPSKITHDENMPKFMNEMFEKIKSEKILKPPFDGERVISATFEVLLDH